MFDIILSYHHKPRLWKVAACHLRTLHHYQWSKLIQQNLWILKCEESLDSVLMLLKKKVVYNHVDICVTLLVSFPITGQNIWNPKFKGECNPPITQADSRANQVDTLVLTSSVTISRIKIRYTKCCASFYRSYQ